MKRILFLISLVLATVSNWASKGFLLPVEVRQADGTTITISVHGDEYFHWIALSDGTIVINTGNGFYIADIDAEGNISPTSQLAHEESQRDDVEKQLIERQATMRNVFFSNGVQKSKTIRKNIPIGNPSTSYFPHTGSPKAIVLLVEFQDQKFSVDDPKASFEMFLNGEEQTNLGRGENRNISSVKKYFEAMSYGQFSPQFDIYGPVTVAGNMADYGEGNTKDKYGDYPEKFTEEACKKIDSEIDFSQYDADNDGYVDLVYLIYAGYGQSNGAPSYTIWPKSGKLSGSYKFDGVYLGRYGLSNELNMSEEYWDSQSEKSGRTILPQINGIGLFCHEFSHTMGLPDLYPYNSDAYLNNQEMEYWDLMDGGEYLSFGYSPAPYTAWERETMGWMSLETLTDSQEGIEMKTIDNGGKAYKIVNEDQPNGREFIVLENVQRTGYGRSLLGHGLLAYHVAYPYATVNLNDLPNDRANYPCVAIIPADGILISAELARSGQYTTAEYTSSHAGDTFPGTSNITALNDESNLPNFKFYATTNEKGGKVGKGLANITEDVDAGTVTFDYISDTTSGIEHIQNTVDGRTDIYSIDGRYMGKDTSTLSKGLYIVNKKKVVIR